MRVSWKNWDGKILEGNVVGNLGERLVIMLDDYTVRFIDKNNAIIVKEVE